MNEKKQYESPKFEKLEFDFTNTVTASGDKPGSAHYGEDGELVGISWNLANKATCTVYAYDDGCYD